MATENTEAVTMLAKGLNDTFGNSLKDVNFKEIASSFVKNGKFRANKNFSVNLKALIPFMALYIHMNGYC